MNKIGETLIISSRDVIAELECDHRLNLEWAVIEKLIERPPVKKNEALELLARIGNEHEDNLGADQASEGSFIEIINGAPTLEAYQKSLLETRKAMADGFETIGQATLFTGDFVGFVDFLVFSRDEHGQPILDSQGRHIYDPVDAKSARTAKRSAVLQVAVYAHIMEQLGMPRPRKVHLWLAGDCEWSANADDVIDLGEDFIRRTRERLNGFSSLPNPTWAPPHESCGRCKWSEHCKAGREAAQDISLVQNMRSSTRSRLVTNNIESIDSLATALDKERPTGAKEVGRETFNNLRLQADIQMRGRDANKILFEPRDANYLSLLPKPSDGDVWFDMEGDPFANNGNGLEYMFGLVWRNSRDASGFEFKTYDARDHDGERSAFIEFIMWIVSRREMYPDMHIYHYASYEKTALLNLAQLHGAMEAEVDQIVRDGVLIDLYKIVRNSFRFSTPSLSIKDVEQVYRGKRNKDDGVANAVDSIVEFELALAELRNDDEPEFLRRVAKIREYNEIDCISTQQLDDWLRKQAAALGVTTGKSQHEILEIDEEFEAKELFNPTAETLGGYFPTNPDDRSLEQQAIANVVASIYYHQRERRPAWWAIFERAQAELEDFESFDDAVLATSVTATGWAKPTPRSRLTREVTIESEGKVLSYIVETGKRHQLLYDPTPVGLDSLNNSNRHFHGSEVIAVSETQIIMSEKTKDLMWDDLPIAILPPAPIPSKSIEAVLANVIGAETLSGAQSKEFTFPLSAWADVLLGRQPRQIKGAALPRTNDVIADITNALLNSDSSYIAVQGPPGTGKTHVGGAVIARLAKAGWRIGVTAQSHAVIENLLNAVHQADSLIPIGKKSSQNHPASSFEIKDELAWALDQSGGFVIGGTAWAMTNTDVREIGFDLIVIDEAGQFALANSIAVICAAKCALLLGDPQQLPQVSQGSHPDPVELSVLGHILKEHKTIPDEYGYFLNSSYRLHPLIAKRVSILQYEGKLSSEARCALRVLDGIDPGLHIVQVEHSDNTVKSEEEAAKIVEMLPTLLGKKWTDTDKTSGLPIAPRALEEKDILVVAAYNKQVRCIKSALSGAGYSKIRVGTFDKFQGQEAAVVFVSMATSSSDDLPRGIEFLLSPNRLNVAISRAQWACYLLRAPQLTAMEPATADGMIMLGKFITLNKGSE